MIEAQRVQRDHDLDCGESQPIRHDDLLVEEEQPVDRKEVDDRCEQREPDLEQRDIGQADASEAAGRPPLDDRAAMLPYALNGSVRPAVSLAPQIAESVRRFGPRHRTRLVHHLEARAMERHRQVGVLGERVVGEPLHLVQRGPTERADRTGHGRHTADDVVHAPIEVEAHDVLEVLPPTEQSVMVGDLRVPRDRADRRVAEWLHERAQRAGFEHRVGVDRHDDLTHRLA